MILFLLKMSVLCVRIILKPSHMGHLKRGKSAMTRSQIRAAVAACPLFSDCAFDESALTAQRFKRGDAVADTRDGEPVIGVIAKGRVGVYGLSPGESAVSLSTLGAGEAFGISNLFTQGPLETRLRCRAPTDIVFIPKQVFLQQLAANPALAQRYMTLLNGKIRFLLRRIALLTAHSGRAKLTDYLLANAGDDGGIWLDCSKAQLAALLGMSRAALFRELAALSDAGLIAVEKNHITLRDRDAVLRQLRPEG